MSVSGSPPPTLVPERALYVGINIQQFLTGVVVCIGVFAIAFTRHHWSMTHAQKAFYVAYILVILFCMIIAVFANGYIGQLMWIDHRNDSGGPFQYFVDETTLWTNVWGSAADIFVNIIGDGFLLYRCYMIWGRSLYIIAFPALVFLGSVVLSIFSLVESALPANNSFFVFASTVNFTVPWVALSTGLNIILTALISFRILRFRHQLLEALKADPKMVADYAKDLDTYTSIAAIVIESALPFSIVGLITSVLVGKGNDVASAFLIIWGTFAGVSPLLIVLRLAMGKAWTHETSNVVSRPLSFATGPHNVAQTFGTTTYSVQDIQVDPSESTLGKPVSIVRPQEKEVC
ncbi:hypothetical protein BDW22DRAFT_1350070 [Trametopsis cervina]|nr:hypothetical protein BDW22DRAFT_1350070 [Trametopsis cervina]